MWIPKRKSLTIPSEFARKYFSRTFRIEVQDNFVIDKVAIFN